MTAPNKQHEDRFWGRWRLSGALGPWPTEPCEKCETPVKVAPVGVLASHLFYGLLCKECMKGYVTMDRRRKEAFWRK